MTNKSSKSKNTILMEIIESKIMLFRGKKVMLDRDLAKLYGISTSNLNKAVRRNIERFPKDFMFQLNKNEIESSRFQIGILKRGYNIKYLRMYLPKKVLQCCPAHSTVKEPFLSISK